MGPYLAPTLVVLAFIVTGKLLALGLGALFKN